MASSLKFSHPLHRPTQSPSSRSSITIHRPCAIGFDLPGSSSFKSPERSGDELSRAAASLLLYQSVLKPRTSQAFLDILLHLQKGSPLKLTEHYGDLYKSLATEGWPSWQDFLVDHALKATDNPFAKAAAKADPTAHFLPAVRHDLNVIQSLAVTEATLVKWVQETVSGLPESWGAAAALLTPPLNTSTVSIDEFILPLEPPPHVLAPLTKEQRAALRSELCQKWEWAEGAELLQRYHSAHDFGLVSQHKILKWSGDRLQAQDVLEGIYNNEFEGSRQDAVVAAALQSSGFLKLNLTERRVGAEPIALIGGCAQDAYKIASIGLKNLETLVDSDVKAAASGVRTVILPHAGLKTIAELAWTLSQHPRVRFAVLCPAIGELDGDVAATISGGDGVGWPANAVFVACCDSAPKNFPGAEVKIT